MTVDARKLEMVLACPVCRAKVTAEADGEWVTCGGCRRRYPVIDGIPIMIAARADSK